LVVRLGLNSTPNSRSSPLTGNEDEAGCEGLEADDSLSSESASEEKQNGSGHEVGSDLGRVSNGDGALGDNDIVAVVVLALNDRSDHARLVLDGGFLRWR
jgi:hypothetical protein